MESRQEEVWPSKEKKDRQSEGATWQPIIGYKKQERSSEQPCHEHAKQKEAQPLNCEILALYLVCETETMWFVNIFLWDWNCVNLFMWVKLWWICDMYGYVCGSVLEIMCVVLSLKYICVAGCFKYILKYIYVRLYIWNSHWNIFVAGCFKYIQIYIYIWNIYEKKNMCEKNSFLRKIHGQG